MFAAAAAAIGFVVIAAFQVALALGAPFGRAAWGGGNPGRLPAHLRFASGVAAGIWIIAAVVVLGRGNLVDVPFPRAVVQWGSWVLVALLSVGAVMNFASASQWERFGWGPFAAVLALLCLIVALG
jgi:hypothetical protein